jgi:2-methylcitrate dehydratase PrpD
VVTDPQIVALRRKVRAEAEKGIHEDQVKVTITTTDGRVHELFVEHAIGSLDRPLSDEELDYKVRDLCEPVLGASGADRFIALCRDVANSSSLASVIEAGIPTR